MKSSGRTELAAILVFFALVAVLALLAGEQGLPPSAAVSNVTGWTIPLLSSSLALGFVVMAIVQLLKPPFRAVFHRREIDRWIYRSSYSDGTPAAETSPPSSRTGKTLTTDAFLAKVSQARADALLELPIEQLAAQIQAAAELALATRGTGNSLVIAVSGKHQRTVRQASDADSATVSSRDTEEVARENTRVSYIIQRRVDALQIEVRQRWRRILRFSCMSISIVLTTLLAAIFGLWKDHIVGTILLVLLLAALGAFFASVARDVVAISERLRG